VLGQAEQLAQRSRQDLGVNGAGLEVMLENEP
jgi:hypothetical protein